MQLRGVSVGIIGGSGMLGRAISRAILERKVVEPAELWISNRSGRLSGFEPWQGLEATDDNQLLADSCRIIVLSVPPEQAAKIAIDAADRLVVSVMAGVTIAEIRSLTGADRVVRAMSSPAAELGLAYSPWVASPAVGAEDRAQVAALLGACGLTDELTDEGLIDCFTALTGPVPGFVAYYAQCMVDSAIAMGIPPEVAERAIRQLFLASGKVMAEGPEAPADHVRQMIAYAGTTAAGLSAMSASPIAQAITDGLNAAVQRSRSLGRRA